MTKEQAEKVLEELNSVRPEKLKGEAKKLFEAIMKIVDERDELKRKAEEQDRIIDKLKKHNDELLRKLRNRVKQVKKLEKYSTYKSGFSRLNKKIEEQDKIIDLMANHIATSDSNLCEYGENKKLW